jgi:hypothetical protein
MRFKIGQKVFLSKWACKKFDSVESLTEHFGVANSTGIQEIMNRWYEDANRCRVGGLIMVDIIEYSKETKSYCYRIPASNPEKSDFTEWVTERTFRGIIKNSPEGMDVICAAR